MNEIIRIEFANPLDDSEYQKLQSYAQNFNGSRVTNSGQFLIDVENSEGDPLKYSGVVVKYCKPRMESKDIQEDDARALKGLIDAVQSN